MCVCVIKIRSLWELLRNHIVLSVSIYQEREGERERLYIRDAVKWINVTYSCTNYRSLVLSQAVPHHSQKAVIICNCSA